MNIKYDEFYVWFYFSICDYFEWFGYYDIFLVDLESGDIVYLVFKEFDFLILLLMGFYVNINIGEVFW